MKRPKPMPVKSYIAKETGINPKRKVIYRKFHDINQTIFLIEICKSSKQNIVILLFPNFERPDLYICDTMPEAAFEKLLDDFNGSYNNLINKNFGIRSGRLFIKGYHGQISTRETKIFGKRGVGTQRGSHDFWSRRYTNKEAGSLAAQQREAINIP